MIRTIVLAAVLVTAPLAATALAQGGAVGGGESPIEVLADDGIEWRQDEQLYIARGNAVAIQGEDRVYGDVLVAHYRDTGDGATEIFRMEARGGTRITSPGRTVTGGMAIYDIDTGILVVRGGPLRMVTETETVTARQSLEYWGEQHMAVARGDARAVRNNGDVIEADVLTGHFAANDAAETAAPGPDGLQQEGLTRLEAFDNVVITTAKEVVRGARAVYDIPAGVATVIGDVTITTEADQLAGERAVVNLNTGVSTLHGGSADGNGDGRARALIAPQRPQTPAPTDTTR